MIKFFRNFRKKLVEQGKTTNYLKYAIGEIILVVIGILIALQINNWNQEKIGHNLERVYLQNLIGDLGYEIGTFELKFQGTDGAIITDIGKFTEVLKRNSEGKWMSIYGMWSANEAAK